MNKPKILSDGSLVIPVFDSDHKIQSLTRCQIAALNYFFEHSECYIDNDFHLGDNLYITLQNHSRYPEFSFKT